MQSFFPHPLLRWFEVRPPSLTASSGQGSEQDDGSNRLQKQIQHSFQASKRSCEVHLSQLSTEELHASQTPPWLRASGIAPFLEGLPFEKVEIRSLKDVPADPVDGQVTIQSLILQAVKFRLLELRDRARPGRHKATVARVVLRHLNSFEPNRMQTKPFYGTQNDETMEKYGLGWTQLLVFLIRVQDHDDECLAERLLYADDTIQSLLDDVTAAAEALRAVNSEKLALRACLHRIRLQGPSLRQHATTLIRAVEDLSVALVRQRCQQDPFSLPVIAYCSTLTLDKHGAWISAAQFRPLLSGIIHCMQLWLLGYCIRTCRERPDGPTLDDFVEEQCRSTLVNTAPTAMGELSYWRLLCRSAKNDTPRPPVTTITDDCMMVQHGALELRLPAWRQYLRELLHEATSLLDGELLFGLTGLKTFPVSSLRDNLNDSQPGRSFVDDPRNGLHAVRDDVVDQLRINPDLRSRFFKDPLVHADEDSLQYHRLAISDYLDLNQRFLQIIAVLFVMTAGLPPRRPELVGIRWYNQEVIRNVFIYDGLLAVFTSYHKSQWRVGNRPVARFLPPCVGDLVVRYLIYVSSVTTLFYHCMQMAEPHGYLFADENGPWAPRQLSAAVKSSARRHLNVSVGIAQWRHMAIALDRRLLQGVSCRVYSITPDEQIRDREDDSDSDRDDNVRPSYIGPHAPLTASSVHALQAAHTVETNMTHYGNTSYPLASMTDILLADFCLVSRHWHQLTQLPSPELIACGRKRPVSLSAELPSSFKRPGLGARLFTRRQLWTWPVIERGLQRLFGSNASTRDSMQRNALRLLARSYAEVIIVMPTGSGKTVLYAVMSVVLAAEVTVVVTPLIALKQDLDRRCREWGLPFWHYNEAEHMEEKLHAVPPLLFVDVETAVTPSFGTFLKQLSDLGRLDRLIIDEAHLVLVASDYRECLGLLAILRQVPCPLVCMTATLPPVGEFDLRQSLLLKDPVVHRTSSDRPNLAYCIQRLVAPPPGSTPISSDELLAVSASRLISKTIEQWQSADTGIKATARSICFVRTMAMGKSLAERLHCRFYHAKLTPIERSSVLTAWSQGTTQPCLIATSALGAGVDYTSVRQIIHVDAPSGLVAYGQETGRAGRDGLHAVCTVLLPPRWSVSWHCHYKNDFLIEDCRQMEAYLKSKDCLRQVLTNYLDGSLGGRDGTACSQEDQISRAVCMNCRQHQSSPSAVDLDSMQIAGGEASRPPSCPDGTDSESSVASSRSVPSLVQDEDARERSITGNESTGNLDEQRFEDAVDMYRVQTMESAEAQALYRRRLSTWGRCCILCSFQRRQRTPFPHEDCMQATYADSLTRFRNGITFERGVGCFACVQPMAICQRKGGGGCQFPWFVYHSCWVALHEDRPYAVEILKVIGGPDLALYTSPELHPVYLQWLGRKHLLFDSTKGSNALRLAWLWSDRLESVCSLSI
ncbi:MAG: hypothetical protein Q9218_005804 [Villophora microphyllina]